MPSLVSPPPGARRTVRLRRVGRQLTEGVSRIRAPRIVQCRSIHGSLSARLADVHQDEALTGSLLDGDRQHSAAAGGRSVARFDVDMQRAQTVRAVVAEAALDQRWHSGPAVKAGEG